MSEHIDYYVSLGSPWTYLGHARFVELAARYGKRVDIYPVDFAAVFAETGGLPVAKRAPARQAYRLVELERWRRFLGVPLTVQPRYFPASDELAARMVIVARRTLPTEAVALAGRVLQAIWSEERDIAARATLVELASELGLDGAALAEAANALEVGTEREADARRAIARGVFGAPTYVYEDEAFWGQDRLALLEWRLDTSIEGGVGGAGGG